MRSSCRAAAAPHVHSMWLQLLQLQLITCQTCCSSKHDTRTPRTTPKSRHALRLSCTKTEPDSAAPHTASDLAESILLHSLQQLDETQALPLTRTESMHVKGGVGTNMQSTAKLKHVAAQTLQQRASCLLNPLALTPNGSGSAEHVPSLGCKLQHMHHTNLYSSQQ
jgi:hypothetical protein